MRTNSMCDLIVFALVAASAAVSDAAPVVIERPTPEVHLVEAGAAPRRPIRMRAPAGSEQVFVTRTVTTISQKFGDIEIPATETPGVSMWMKNRVEEVRLDGEMTVSSSIESIRVDNPKPGDDPMVHDAIAGMIDEMRNFSATVSMTDRGIVTSVSANVPEFGDADVDEFMNTMVRAFEQISVPYPAEAVGVGAKWRVNVSNDTFGVPMEVESEFEILALDGDIVTIRSVVRGGLQDGKPFEDPGMAEQGVSVVIESMKMNGAAEYTHDLRRIAPRRLTITATSETATRAVIEGMDPIIGEAKISIAITTQEVESDKPIGRETGRED